MRTIGGSACKARNDYQAEKCASCGEPLAMARTREAMQGIGDTTARFQHQQAARNPFFLMLATAAWAGYIILLKTRNDGGACKPLPAPTIR